MKKPKDSKPEDIKNPEDEEKTEKTSEPENADILQLFDETKEVTVVKNTQDKKDIKAEKKKERKKKHPNKVAFLLGLIILIFAILGIVLTAVLSVRYISSTKNPGGEYGKYNTYLTPIAAVDPDPFDDITGADMEQLLDVAIRSILSADTTPDTYKYQNGYMIIPANDITASFTAIFGPEISGSIRHGNVQSYNCVFEYDKTANSYKIPITTVTPIYTPRVTSAQQTGDTLVLIVEYISAESWNIDDAGSYTAPKADKIMKVTLREINNNYYIGAIQTVSSTTPETIYYEPNTTAAAPQTEAPSDNVNETLTEKPTAKDPAKTTLGGRI